MNIKFFNSRQAEIADLMWNAHSLNEALQLMHQYGIDGTIAFNMILAEMLDSVNHTDIASEVLSKF